MLLKRINSNCICVCMGFLRCCYYPQTVQLNKNVFPTLSVIERIHKDDPRCRRKPKHNHFVKRDKMSHTHTHTRISS